VSPVRGLRVRWAFVDTGATVGFGIGGPYDASKYDGISFWAKIDSGSYGLRVAFPDKDTLPDGGLCEGSAPENQCWDHYGYRITNLTTEWTKYTVSFSSLTQDGWGRSGAASTRRPSSRCSSRFRKTTRSESGSTTSHS